MPNYWIFRSPRSHVIAIAKEPSSAALPPVDGRAWPLGEEIAINPGEKGVVGVESTDRVIAEIEERGYFIWTLGRGGGGDRDAG